MRDALARRRSRRGSPRGRASRARGDARRRRAARPPSRCPCAGRRRNRRPRRRRPPRDARLDRAVQSRDVLAQRRSQPWSSPRGTFRLPYPQDAEGIVRVDTRTSVEPRRARALRIASADAQRDPASAGQARPALAQAGGEDGPGLRAGGRADRGARGRGPQGAGGVRRVRGPAGARRSARHQPVAAPTSLREIGAVLKQSLEGFKDAVGEIVRRSPRRARSRRRGAQQAGPARSRTRPSATRSSPPSARRVTPPARRSARPRRPRSPSPASRPPAGRSSRTSSRALRSTGLAAHPERVYGVYRVPDRFDHNRNSEAKAYVEWEIAHAPGALRVRRGRGPHDRLQARRPLGRAPRRRAVRARRGRRGRARHARADRARGLLRPAPADAACTVATPRTRRKTWTPLIEGVLLFSRPLPAIAPAQAQMTARGAARARRAAAVPRRDPRLGGGRRLGLPAPLRPASRSRRRCRTCRAPGRSC